MNRFGEIFSHNLHNISLPNLLIKGGGKQNSPLQLSRTSRPSTQEENLEKRIHEYLSMGPWADFNPFVVIGQRMTPSR
ncbi:MAG: hypothetical protein CL661_09205 [Bacteroidetes bacterium]|nr:hypothetical protein [Bacteroidota bacterium]